MFEDEKRDIAQAAAGLLSAVAKFSITIAEQAREVAIGAARAIKTESDPQLSMEDTASSLLSAAAELDCTADVMTSTANSHLKTIVELGGALAKAAEVRIIQAQESDCHSKQSSTIRKQVWDLTGGKCAYCDTELAPDGNGSLSFVVEHVVPTSQGGPDNLANYVPACMSCNTSKGADHVLLFIQRRFPNRARPQTYTPDRTE